MPPSPAASAKDSGNDLEMKKLTSRDGDGVTTIFAVPAGKDPGPINTQVKRAVE